MFPDVYVCCIYIRVCVYTFTHLPGVRAHERTLACMRLYTHILPLTNI